MDNKIYDDYMLNLFKDCSLKAFDSEKIMIASKKEKINVVNKLFLETSSIFNHSIAFEFIESLHNSNPGILSKVTNYPSLFWKTSEGESHMLLGIKYEEEKSLTEILAKLKEYKYNLLESVLSQGMEKEEVSEAIEKDITKFNLTIAKSTFLLGKDTFLPKAIRSISNFRTEFNKLLLQTKTNIDPKIFLITTKNLLPDQHMSNYLSSAINADFLQKEDDKVSLPLTPEQTVLIKK